MKKIILQEMVVKFDFVNGDFELGYVWVIIFGIEMFIDFFNVII